MSSSKDIAIVGMAGLFPQAPDVAAFWQNILDKVDAVTDRAARPGHCDRGGFLDGLARFDPAGHGVPPRSVDGGDPEHFIALRLAREALADAGYLDPPFPRQRTAVILGRVNYGSRGYGTLFQHAVVVDQVIRLLATLHPEHSAAELAGIEQQLRASLPPFDADTAPGLVPSVLCGRIANRLDLMGSAYVVDAACASSLVAVELAMGELLTAKADLALAGGIHVSSTVPITMLFGRLGALSHRGVVRPFSADADGTLLGEGAGVLVLKRRADAERDGDRIYAVLKSVGVASDGRAVGVLAPRVEGEELAMRRAYDAAGVAPGTVALVEAHGTGTPVGDAVELEALGRVFGPVRDGGPRHALGSVKSMIGHPIPAAGVAGLIKAALALHHKVLPPTLGGGDHLPRLESTPFHLNTETRPWINAGPQPRRAAVSAFGFGGINAHAVLEEHSAHGPGAHLHRRFDAEVLMLSGRDRTDLRRRCADLRRVLAGSQDFALADLAYTLNCAPGGIAAARVAIVATSVADLDGKLALALDRLADPACRCIDERSGVYYTEAPLYAPGTLAFLFPGQGAQYPAMLADLCVHFPEVRAWFDLMDRPFAEQRRPLPSRLLFPPPEGGGISETAALWAMDYGLTAVYTANQALSGLLGRLGIRPDAVLGHSSGDFSALWQAGVLPVDDDAELVRQVVVLNEVYQQLRGEGRLPSGTLFAVSVADPEHVQAAVEHSDGALTVAMDNCPRQVVLGGAAAPAATATEELRRAGAVCTNLPVDYLPHTPHFAEFAARLRELHHQREGQVRYRLPQTTLYSSVTAARYPADPAAVHELVTEQWSQPVRFRETIETMHADGVRIFIEAGPRGSLAAFTGDILRGAPHLAVPADADTRSCLTQLAHLLAQLAAHHVPMTLDHLYAHRSPRRLWAGDGPVPVPPAEPDCSVRLAVDLPLLTLDRPSPPLLAPEPPAPMPPAPMPPASAPPVNGAREEVMVAYLETMDRFLEVQRHAVRTCVSAPAPQRLPLLGSVISCIEGRELIALRRLDPEHDLFLRDHTFGRSVSQLDPSLLGLPVVPFTVSMEILAEAAATLLPGHVVTGLRQVRAHQWIALDDGPVTLRVVARRVSSDREVTVELYRLAGDGSDSAEAGTRMVEGTVVLAGCYPAPQLAPELTLRGERACGRVEKSLYADRMFHGPHFQGVVALDRWGEDGLLATMTTLPADELFAATPEPTLLTDPQLLDAAGQLVGFWALERHDRGCAFFPFSLDELQLFGPPPPAGTLVTGRARISMLGDAQLRSDLDLAGPDGLLLARLTGWANHRLALPEPLAGLGTSPRDASLAVPWTGLTSRLPGAVACRVDDLPLGPHGRIWERALAHIVLSRGERAAWSRLPGPDRHRSEWLLRRVAAKDAVRALLRATSGVALCPADVEIVEQPDGKLVAAGHWIRESQESLAVSLATRDGTTVAVAGHCRGIGVTLEHLASNGTGRAEAHQLIAALEEPLRAEWALRLRCAQQAAAALNGAGPSTVLTATDLDTAAGTVLLTSGSERHTVQTAREDNRIAALAIR